MVSGKNKVAVIYLAWLPYGIQHFMKFIDSYKVFFDYTPHQFILVINGMSRGLKQDAEQYIDFAHQKGIIPDNILYFENGQDLDIYQQTARIVHAEYIIFLNTYSRILHAGWLSAYLKNFNNEVGIIGASGSLQSYLSSVFQKNKLGLEFDRSFKYNYKKYKLFFKALFYWSFLFKKFPNPHIRTNAFMVRRKDFLEIDLISFTSKFKAYLFESGKNSLTNHYLKKGMDAIVIDKSGLPYKLNHWKASKTFWTDNQQNLLISDNQTTIYQEASQSKRAEMTKLAWGK